MTEDIIAVAVVGAAIRAPGANDLTQFWNNLSGGLESIRQYSDHQLSAAGVSNDLINHPDYVKSGAPLDEADCFDAAVFGYTPHEAEVMDPQHRVFLESAWSALENAGYAPGGIESRVGVFAGCGMNTYLLRNLISNRNLMEREGDYPILIGSDKDFMPTRTAYKLNLKGPAFNVNTACSSSLVAIHLACHSLISFQCDMALSGGSSIRFPQQTGYLYEEGLVLSPDGHCRAFDAKAAGTVGGSGVGVVVLKRLEDAIADRDNIYAVIRGSAINNDGSQKVGFTAPSVSGQAEVIAEAQTLAGVDPATVSYVEAHGTATSLGDPIEVAALTEAFSQSDHPHGAGQPYGAKPYCALGSVKTNIGHLDAAAGVAGLIKTVLALKNRQIPPSLNYQSPNPRIDFDTSPFYVNTQLKDWPAGETPRRAGVSSFGIGGTNAHVVLEEAPQPQASDPPRSTELLILSAKTSDALQRSRQNLRRFLEENPQSNLADVGYTLAVGRRQMEHRLAVSACSVQDAIKQLEDDHGVAEEVEDLQRKVAFLFPGQGAAYDRMGKQLYANVPYFASQIDRCHDLLKEHSSFDLRQSLFDQAVSSDPLQAQLGLFALEYSLAQTLCHWGVTPGAALGHSLGEYVGATLAGVFQLPDVLWLLTQRATLMQDVPPGAMLAVAAGEAEVRDVLGDGVDLACVNGSRQIVLSGKPSSIERVEITLAQRQIACRRMSTTHGFHSSLLDGVLSRYESALRQIDLQPPQSPMISNVTGDWADETMAEPEYWVRQMRHTVQFDHGLQTLLHQPRLLMEVGPGHTLTRLCKTKSPLSPVSNTLERPNRDQPNGEHERDGVARCPRWLGLCVESRRDGPLASSLR